MERHRTEPRSQRRVIEMSKESYEATQRSQERGSRSTERYEGYDVEPRSQRRNSRSMEQIEVEAWNQGSKSRSKEAYGIEPRKSGTKARDPRVRKLQNQGQSRSREHVESDQQVSKSPRASRYQAPPGREQVEGSSSHRTPSRRTPEREQQPDGQQVDYDYDDADSGGQHPGYHTAEYSRESKLEKCVFQDVTLKRIRMYVEKLMEVLTVTGTMLILPLDGKSSVPISKQWRRVQKKSVLDTGALLLHIFMELFSFFETNGLPTQDETELVYKLFQIFPINGGILETVMGEDILDRDSSEIKEILRGVVSSGVWEQLKEGADTLTTNLAITLTPWHIANGRQPDLHLRSIGCRPTMLETYDLVEHNPWVDRLLALQKIISKKSHTSKDLGRLNLISKRWGVFASNFRHLHRTEEIFPLEYGKPSITMIKQVNGLPATREDLKEIIERMVTNVLAPIRAETKVLRNQVNRMEQMLTQLTGSSMNPEVITLSGEYGVVAMNVPVVEMNVPVVEMNVPVRNLSTAVQHTPQQSNDVDTQAPVSNLPTGVDTNPQGNWNNGLGQEDNKTIEIQVHASVPSTGNNMDPRMSDVPQQSDWAAEVAEEDARRYGQSHPQEMVQHDDGTLLLYPNEHL